MAERTSAISAVSVISRHSADGSSPESASASEMSSSSPTEPSCRGERFTAISRPRPAVVVRQRAAAAHASRTTHAPIGTIRPLCSAIGMNFAGETMPCTGCAQRSSASTATIRPDARSTSGW